MSLLDRLFGRKPKEEPSSPRPLLKQFGDLTAEDLICHPVWIGVHVADYDEPWYDDCDEETFRPWTGAIPVGSEEMYLVSCRFSSADGTAFRGFVTPSTSTEMGTLQPQLFAPSGDRVAFWHGMFPSPNAAPFAYAALDKTPDQLFPLQFEALEGLTTAVASGVIPGFMSSPDSNSIEISK